MTQNAAHIALMPTEEWIAFMLDVWHEGWRYAGASAENEYMTVDEIDERGPWFIQTTGTEGELIVNGKRCFSACWR